MENISKEVFDNASVSDNSNTSQRLNGINGSTHTGNQPLYLLVPDWTITAATVFTVAMFVVAIPANVILITVLHREKKKSSTDIYIISLAASYIASLLLYCPVELARFNPSLWTFIGSDLLCRLHYFVNHWMFLLSTVLVFTIGVDRFLKVFKPHSSVNMNTVSRKVCIAEFCVSALYSVIFALTTHQNNLGLCTYNWDYWLFNAISYAILNIVATVTSTVLAWFYFKIALFLKNRETFGIGNGFRDTTTDMSTSQASGSENAQCKRKVSKEGPGAGPKVPNQAPSGTDPSTSTTPAQLPVPSTSTALDNPVKIIQSVHDTRIKTRKRTNITMTLVTIVFFFSTVLPSAGLAVTSTITITSDDANIAVFLVTRLPILGYVANPILFVISSSGFREKAALVLKNFFKRRATVLPN